MPPPSKRVHEAESSSSASAPKRIGDSAATWGRAGFEAGTVMNSHCFTWQNASLKEPDGDTERYPWRMPTPAESEPVPTPDAVGPIALWRTAMIPKYDLMMIEFDRDGKNWTIMQRSKHYSVSRTVKRDQPQSVNFKLIVTDPPMCPHARSSKYLVSLQRWRLCHMEHVHLLRWYRVQDSWSIWSRIRPSHLYCQRLDAKTNVDCRNWWERKRGGCWKRPWRGHRDCRKSKQRGFQFFFRRRKSMWSTTMKPPTWSNWQKHQNSSSATRRSLLYMSSMTKTMEPLSKLATSQPKKSQQCSWTRQRRHGNGRTAGLQPAVTYAASVPVIDYVSPIFAVYAATVPVHEYATPVLLICRQERWPRSVVASSCERGLPIWSARKRFLLRTTEDSVHVFSLSQSWDRRKFWVSVRFLLTIDPSVSTLHSTSLSCTLHIIFMTRALQTFVSSNCVRWVCASHPQEPVLVHSSTQRLAPQHFTSYDATHASQGFGSASRGLILITPMISAGASAHGPARQQEVEFHLSIQQHPHVLKCHAKRLPTSLSLSSCSARRSCGPRGTLSQSGDQHPHDAAALWDLEAFWLSWQSPQRRRISSQGK